MEDNPKRGGKTSPSRSPVLPPSGKEPWYYWLKLWRSGSLPSVGIIFFLLIFFSVFGAQTELELIREELQTVTGTKFGSVEILNVSYDPTREFYEAYNTMFSKWWKERTGQRVSVVQSHGGSGKQARSVISGLNADVVTLALAFDIDAIQKLTGEVGYGWQNRLPNHSTPYFSTIVFLVRKGNPKHIRDWDDLVKKGVSVVTANPKTSGASRWGYMAAWGYAKNKGINPKAFVMKLFANVGVLDTGARGSATTFIQRKLGDVLITWENEAYLILDRIDGEFEVVYPSISIQADPSVAWLIKIIEQKGTEDVAKYYLKYLYSKEAQELIAKHHFRPFDETVATSLPKIKLFTIEDFGGWDAVQEEHFKDNGTFDQIFLSEEGVAAAGQKHQLALLFDLLERARHSPFGLFGSFDPTGLIK